LVSVSSTDIGKARTLARERGYMTAVSKAGCRALDRETIANAELADHDRGLIRVPLYFLAKVPDDRKQPVQSVLNFKVPHILHQLTASDDLTTMLRELGKHRILVPGEAQFLIGFYDPIVYEIDLEFLHNNRSPRTSRIQAVAESRPDTSE
jgi:hypothetical protein